jgi:hypothetical protein
MRLPKHGRTTAGKSSAQQLPNLGLQATAASEIFRRRG